MLGPDTWQVGTVLRCLARTSLPWGGRRLKISEEVGELEMVARWPQGEFKWETGLLQMQHVVHNFLYSIMHGGCLMLLDPGFKRCPFREVGGPSGNFPAGQLCWCQSESIHTVGWRELRFRIRVETPSQIKGNEIGGTRERLWWVPEPCLPQPCQGYENYCGFLMLDLPQNFGVFPPIFLLPKKAACPWEEKNIMERENCSLPRNRSGDTS